MLEALLHADLGRPWVDRDGETQRDLIAHAHRIAAALDPRGRRVVLSCRRARAFVPGLLGAWLAGATVELLPNVQPGTLDRVDADDEVAHVLHDAADRQGRSPRAIYVPAVLAGTAPAPAPAAPWPEIAVRMTTSGTTERPKSVEKAMAQLLDEIAVHAVAFPAGSAVLSTVPLSHIYGLLWGLLWPLRTGARIVDHDALLPADIAKVIEREAADVMISTPAHLRAMAAARMPRGLRVLTSGARLPAELHMALVTERGWQVTDVLGSTETGGIATRQHPMHGWAPLPGVAVTAPSGQLVVESPWCDGGRTEIDDRIELRPDGTFHYLGRTTEVVKIAGKRAHGHAIEATVLAVPGVTDVALIVHGAAGKEPRIALAITVAPDGPPVGRDDVAQAIRRQFDAVFAPRIVKIVPRIPRTERGKLDAQAVRELLGVDTDNTTDRVPLTRVAPGEYLAYIPHELVFFRGHFDALAVLPGAALVERVVWPTVKTEWPEIAAMRAIKRLRFRRPILPGQRLSIKVHRERGPVVFEVACGEAVVATGQLVVA